MKPKRVTAHPVMGTKVVSAEDIKRLTRDHLQVGRAMRDLKTALSDRRGRKTPAANLTNARKALNVLECRLINHMAMEEKTLFPFLKKFFPDYDLVIRLLCNEHDSFKRYMRQIRRGGSSSAILREGGYCLLSMLKGHGRIEDGLFRRYRTSASSWRRK